MRLRADETGFRWGCDPSQTSGSGTVIVQLIFIQTMYILPNISNLFRLRMIVSCSTWMIIAMNSMTWWEVLLLLFCVVAVDAVAAIQLLKKLEHIIGDGGGIIIASVRIVGFDSIIVWRRRRVCLVVRLDYLIWL